MLRKRLITLLIETDEGRPEEWDWENILSVPEHGNTTVTVVHVEEG
jgi:hypothetical protein